MKKWDTKTYFSEALGLWAIKLFAQPQAQLAFGEIAIGVAVVPTSEPVAEYRSARK